MPAQLSTAVLFLAIAGVTYALLALLTAGPDRVEARVRRLSEGGGKPGQGDFARLVREELAKVAARLGPAEPGARDRLRRRLVHAGYTDPAALLVLSGARVLLPALALAAGAGLALSGWTRPLNALAATALLVGLATVAPGLWLDSRTRRRQGRLQRALPDFFDVLVLCLESGVGMRAAWRRVSDELQHAHPELWRELTVIGREYELGSPLGDALRRFADRTNLDDVDSLAAVVSQAEALGTELARPLATLADSLRVRRVQRAEEAAHRSATMIVFPTLLLIFPSVFAVILGPLAAQVLAAFGGDR